MIETGWSSRRVARQLGHSDCVAQVAPSLGAPVSSRTIRRRLTEEHFGIVEPITCVALDAHPSKPQFGVVPRTRKLDCSEMELCRL
ncbi:hypothetical protein TNCV_693411 [Trichonephila clavipes]|nr:hypothetical protein TNCV_693411 [Trichonephila clavipes]